MLTPVTVPESEVSQWTEQGTFPFSLAKLFARTMPRGKGWFPRWIGRNYGMHMKLVIRTSRSALLAVDPSNLDIYTSIILHSGFWEQHVLEACVAVLQPGHVFYDIGANAGYMSIEIANHFNCKVKVVAFEPQPSLSRVITISAQLNHFTNFRVYEVMLGKIAGIGELFIPAHAIHASTIPREGRAKRIECLVTTLDAQVTNGYIPPPDVIKIDVEGSELDVFQGAQQTIRNYAPAIVFEADDNMERFGYGLVDICDYLSSLVDYRFYRIEEHGVIHPVPNINNAGYANFLAMPVGRAWVCSGAAAV